MSKAKAASSSISEHDLCARHMGIGWCALLIFLSMGLFLESLHGFKAGFYLDVSSEARRTMWTLSHAHGALISVVNIVFGISTTFLPAWPSASRTRASRCFIGALVLLPLGFFLGGFFIHGGDPGIGVFLVPPGGLLFVAAVFLTARAALAQSKLG
ncbi:MAG: hypothetical protein ACKVK6_09070 [bacterium]